jgi:hypothetical protein
MSAEGRDDVAFFRFHKSRSILPGVRVNVSKSGLSLSVGPKGARLNVGPQGVRTTVGLPGSGLSVIHRKSWNALMNGTAGTQTSNQRLNQHVDVALGDMTKDQRRDLFRTIVAGSSLDDVRSQRAHFEAQIAEHMFDIDEGDKADIEEMRRIYAEAIALKERQARYALLFPLLLAAAGSFAMWRGIQTGNGWLIAGSLVLFLWAGGTNAGLRFVYGLLKGSRGLVALFFVALIIGAATLLIVALSGHLNR